MQLMVGITEQQTTTQVRHSPTESPRSSTDSQQTPTQSQAMEFRPIPHFDGMTLGTDKKKKAG
jgi:hypothetical protein